MEKAVFIDKDGTLIVNVPYNVDPSLVELMPDSVEGLVQLQNEGYLLVVISNQAGVAHGFFKEVDLLSVNEIIRQKLKPFGLKIAAFYYCPHSNEGIVPAYTTQCNCRKPKPGLLLKAASDLNIRLSDSWMIGDILNDVEAGNRSGCSTVLLNNGGETEWLLTPGRTPDITAKTINEAASFILSPQHHHEQLEKL